MIDRGRRAATVLGVALLTASGAWYYDPGLPPPPLEDDELAGQPLLEVVRRLRHEVRELRRETLGLRREARELRCLVDHLQAEQQILTGDARSHLEFDELVCREGTSDRRLDEWVGLTSRMAKP